MADPIAGMARVIAAAPHDPDDVFASAESALADHEHEARAAWAYALARLREPNVAMGRAAKEAMAAPGACPQEVRIAMLNAFAREHGLEPPAEPQEGRSGPEGCSGSPEDESAPQGPENRRGGGKENDRG